MKLAAKILSLGVMLAASAPFALAGNIVGTINGFGTYAPITTTSASTFTYSPSTTVPTDNANFNGVNFGVGQMTYFTVNTTGSNPGTLFTFTNGANTLTFTTTSVASTNNFGAISYQYTGTLAGTLNNVAVSSAFSEVFATTGSGGATAFANVSATPEPSSLAFLGTGLLGVVGVARRRFKA